MRKRLRFMALFCALLLLGGCGTVQKQTAEPSACGTVVDRLPQLADRTNEEYVLCAEDDGLKLFVQPSTTAFYVQTPAGERWYSCPEDREEDWFADGIYKMEMSSLMVVRYIDTASGENSRFNTMTGSVYDGTYQLRALENGFRADYEFAEYGAKIPLCVYLEDGMLRARVLLDQIEKPDTLFIEQIALLPFFGAGGEKDEGYLFVADGEGGIIRFNDGKSSFSSYRRPIFGQEPSELPDSYDLTVEDTAVRLPVFGIRRNGAAFVAVVEESAASGELCAFTNLQQTGYANVYVDFQVQSKMDYDLGSIKTPLYESGAIVQAQAGVAYRFLSGDAADYSGMARSYRRYLLDSGLVPIADSAPTLYVELVGGVNKSVSHLGIRSEQVLPLTTTAQAAEVAAWLKDSGVDGLVVRYTAWQKDELAGKTPGSLKIAGSLEKGGVTLQDLLDDGNMTFYPSLEAITTFAKGSFLRRTFSSATDLSGVTMRWKVFSPGLGLGDGDPFYRLSAEKRADALEKIAALAADSGRIALSDTVSVLYNDFRGSVCKRDRMSGEISAWLSGLSADTLLVSPNAYALAAADRIVGAPVSSSGHDLIDASVPFYGMVMSGLRPYAAQGLNTGIGDDAVLRAIECGAQPSFTWICADVSAVKNTDRSDLSGCGYLRTRDAAVQLFALYQKLYRATEGSPLCTHRIIADGVTVSGYENGATVYVNRGDTAVTLPDGVSLSARTCRITKGDEIDEQTTPPVL